MHEINSIAILGVGAMGAYFATRFYDTGFSTTLVARGERLDRLKKDGIVVNGKPYHLPAIAPEEADAPVDLVLVGVKRHHLDEAIRGLGRLVCESTIFISILNGLDSEEVIGAIYGMDKVLYATSLGIDALRVGNRVTYTVPGTHYFGEAHNGPVLSARVERVKAAFDKAGIKYVIPEDMIRTLWWKFQFNVGINQASAVTRAPYRVFQTNPDAQRLMEALMEEVLALAVAMKVDLTREDMLGWYAVLNRLSPEGKTSMLQDVEAGRKTEVELFSGKMIELGKAYGVPTPVNQTVYEIIRVLEQS